MLRHNLAVVMGLALLGSAFSAEQTQAQPRHSRRHPPPPSVRSVEPLVSPQWISENIGVDNLIVVDIRPAEAYALDHIAGSVSAPLDVVSSVWTTVRDDLLLEFPDEAELFASLGQLGVIASSTVVVVGDPTPDQPPFYGGVLAARVADTLLYAGVVNVAILDGGYQRWVNEGLPRTTTPTTPVAVAFDGRINQRMVVSADYVEARLESAILIDTRTADAYFGTLVEALTPVPGHIPGARSLPAPWIYQDDGTYIDLDDIREMAASVIGRHRHREVIVYCGAGGFASPWWFLLTQELGYRNVKFYDGSTQDWIRTHDMVRYRWE